MFEKIQEIEKEINDFLKDERTKINISLEDLEKFLNKISHWKFIFWNQDKINGKEWDEIINYFSWMVDQTNELKQKGLIGLSLYNFQSRLKDFLSHAPFIIGIGAIFFTFILISRWWGSIGNKKIKKTIKKF